jgi:hypothetical protein
VDTALSGALDPSDQQIDTIYRQLAHFRKEVSEQWMVNRQAE